MSGSCIKEIQLTVGGAVSGSVEGGSTVFFLFTTTFKMSYHDLTNLKLAFLWRVGLTRRVFG